MKLNRRSFVAALATSMTSAAAIQASGGEEETEHPDLLALSDRLPGTLNGYTEARRTVHEIEQTWGPQWPTPDPRLFEYYGSSGKRHTDIRGRGVRAKSKYYDDRVHYLGTPQSFQKVFERHTKEAERKSKLKTQRGMKREQERAEESREAIEPARFYWSEVERIEKASGIREAEAVLMTAREDLLELVGDILTFEEQSAIGLGIKAEALAAFTELPPFWQGCNPKAPEWLAGLTATLARRVA